MTTHACRTRTIPGHRFAKRLPREQVREAEAVLAEYEDQRPRCRGDCRHAQRPCPWVSCRFHLYLDVTDLGGLLLHFPEREPWEMQISCALDVAEAGEAAKRDDVADLLNVTHERIRQIEADALRKAKRRPEAGQAMEAVRERCQGQDRQRCDKRGEWSMRRPGADAQGRA